MMLQRPIVADLRWLGHRWAIALRVAPGTDWLIVYGQGPGNDNAWTERVTDWALSVMAHGERPFEAMHRLLRERLFERLRAGTLV